MRRKDFDDMVLMLHAGVSILDAKPDAKALDLWKFLARDLLQRIDRAVPQRAICPSLEIPDDQAAERDDGHPSRGPCPYWPRCGCGTQSGPHSCEWNGRDALRP